jgi:hypothetical protein
MASGHTWSHGVQVRRRATNGAGDRRASQVLIRRICVRYEDGRRVCWFGVPSSGTEWKLTVDLPARRGSTRRVVFEADALTVRAETTAEARPLACSAFVVKSPNPKREWKGYCGERLSGEGASGDRWVR